MYTQTQAQNVSESMDTTTEGRNTDEETDNNDNGNQRSRTSNAKQQRSLSTANNDTFSISTATVPTGDNNAAYLLREANLPDLIPLDTVDQIRYFLNERFQLINEVELVRQHYDQQYLILKHHLDELETENETLTAQHRSSCKQLLLYKNLFDAPENSDLSTQSKDYQQFKLTIEEVVRENERLYGELHHFKTSDPVYEQVQLLETANQHLKQELNQVLNANQHLQQMIDLDEIKQLKIDLNRTLEECDQLKLANKKLVQPQNSSSKQASIFPSPPSSLSNQQRYHPQEQLSPISNRSSRSIEEPLSTDYSTNDIAELREHVQRLEQTLQKRDYELQKLQNEIEKGTSSIMSSIEDIYIASTNISSPINTHTHSSSPDHLDQLHDKLDELTRENQRLKTRMYEVDTIYEENEYLYAEKSQWTEEMERVRMHQLALEQEMNTLKQREKEFMSTNDSTMSINNSNISQLHLEIDWLHRTNLHLEGEIIHLREQIDLITQTYEQEKRDLIDQNHHYQQLLQVAQDAQKFPEELIRIENRYMDREIQFDHERQEYEKRINDLIEQIDKKDQDYNSLHDTVVKVRNEYYQKEHNFVRRMNETVKQQDTIHDELTSFQNLSEQLQEENNALKQELNSKNEINRDLKLALTSSQIPHLNTNLTELQEKYNYDIAQYTSQIEMLRTAQKQIIANYDSELLKTHQTIIQLQHDNNQYVSQLERFRLNIDKLQSEINEKQNFIEQLQNDLSERSALHLSITNQLSEENKIKIMKITELEQVLVQEQQKKIELQQTIEGLSQSRTIEKESDILDQQTVDANTALESAKRELCVLKNELTTKSDQTTILQHTIEDEHLKRQRLEMKLKRLKEEYMNVRTDLYNRIEDNNTLQHELIECRLKLDYYSQISTQLSQSIRPSDETNSSTTIQLYIKERADNLHCQLKCRTYQEQIERLQKNHELLKEKYKQHLQEERNLFERTKMKYAKHIRNIQKDLQETRRLLQKDAEMKMNQEIVYQQLIDERKQLLTNMVDKDAKEREIRRENLLLTSKIQLLENQMEKLNDRIDQTIREQGQLRRDVSNVRLDINLSSEASASSSPLLPSRRTKITYTDSTGRTEPIYCTESVGSNHNHTCTTSPVS